MCQKILQLIFYGGPKACSPDKGGRALNKLLKGSNSAHQSMSALQSFASEIFPVQEIVFVGTAWLDLHGRKCSLFSKQEGPLPPALQGSKGRHSNGSEMREMRWLTTWDKSIAVRVKQILLCLGGPEGACLRPGEHFSTCLNLSKLSYQVRLYWLLH